MSCRNINDQENEVCIIKTSSVKKILTAKWMTDKHEGMDVLCLAKIDL